MNVLITGGAGFIASHLASILVEQGHWPVLLDPAPLGGRLGEILDEVDYVQGGVQNLSVLLNTMRDFAVDTVFHLGGMLSVPSEQDPFTAYDVNVGGTRNVLEAARLGGVGQVVFTSSIAVYGEGLPPGPVDDQSLQRPTSMYGVSKVFGELMGLYYARRFGLDFRGLRLPSIVGPGSKVAHMSIYNCWAIEEPLKGNPYRITVPPETRCPAMYCKDAARALWLLSMADEVNIKTRVYNITGARPAYSALELAEEVRRHLPQADLDFAPDLETSRLIEHIGRLDLDDSPARQEWGWEPSYDLPAMVADFIEDFNRYREYY